MKVFFSFTFNYFLAKHNKNDYWLKTHEIDLYIVYFLLFNVTVTESSGKNIQTSLKCLGNVIQKDLV
jgi:hypothetical protein